MKKKIIDNSDLNHDESIDIGGHWPVPVPNANCCTRVEL